MSKSKDEFATSMNKAVRVIDTAMRFKKVMQRRRLRRAKTKCPFCYSGHLHGTLNGRKDHIHMSCDTCDVNMME